MNYSQETAKKLKRSLIKFKPAINDIVQDIVDREINSVIKCKKIGSSSDISKILQPYVLELSYLIEKKKNINLRNDSFIELAELAFREEILGTLIITLRRELANTFTEMRNKENNHNFLKPSKTIKMSFIKHLKELFFHR